MRDLFTAPRVITALVVVMLITSGAVLDTAQHNGLAAAIMASTFIMALYGVVAYLNGKQP